ncbi:MAG: hypothetical protein WBF15_09940 [Candidatus Sulfotelmatobacter sp.]
MKAMARVTYSKHKRRHVSMGMVRITSAVPIPVYDDEGKTGLAWFFLGRKILVIGLRPFEVL